MAERVPVKDQGFRWGSNLWIAIGLATAAYVAIGLGVAAYDGTTGARHWHTRDDQMITQRVAFMIHEIARPYFNENEAVAANTSLTWPAILSIVYTVFDLSGGVVATILISIALTIASAGVAVTIVPPGPTRIVALAAILFTPGLLIYGPSGWEHIPQALLLTLAFADVLLKSERSGRLRVPTRALILASLSFLLRADSAPTILVIGLGWALTDRRLLRARTYVVGLLLLLIPAFYFAAMITIYGEPVPNTVYLKVGGLAEGIVRGLRYIRQIEYSGHVPILLGVAAVFALVTRGGLPGLWLILTAAAVHTAFVIVLGGDAFYHGRFFLIYVPILTVAVAAIPARRFPSHPWRAAIGSGLLLACFLYLAGAPLKTLAGVRLAVTPPSERQNNYAQQIRVATEIKTRLEPSDGSIGLHFLGIGYHLPRFHVTDFLGKAEPVIARSEPRPGPVGHNKWDYAYAFDAYDIAAVPIHEKTVVRVEASNYTRDPHRLWVFWEDAVVEMKTRGYVFIDPVRFGNPPGGFGLYIRPDLAPRFQ